MVSKDFQFNVTLVQCTVDFDCPINQVCSGGTCVDHAICPIGTHWDESQKACVIDTCTIDADCPIGQICKDGTCITPTKPIDWTPLIVLGTLVGATILISTVVATEK